MRRLALAALVVLVANSFAATNEPARAPQFLLDSGEGGTFSDPKRLAELGYNGQITGSIQGIQLFDEIAPGLLPEGSQERQWALARAAALQKRIRAVHAAGLRCFASTDLIVLPKALVAKLKDKICDENGRFDTRLPKMQELLRAMFRETFDRLPELDGVVIRTGEIYLHDYPYHAASATETQSVIQSNTAILRRPETHIDLIRILRDEVCVKRNRFVFYRTWDWGAYSFTENADYYLKVTDAIETHPNLIFSIKHQKGDFHQLTVFNPTLMIGKHRQIVEVQSQREAYGKGAHPYYIGQGVIEGWEEYAWMMQPGQNKGLRDIVNHPLYAGVWTWSRGGGWDGPHITDDFWCRLNTWVVSQYARNPSRREADLFDEYAAKMGLAGPDIERFRELNLLSEKAVLRGQLTCLGANINVWWARDDVLEAPDLKDFIKKGLVEKALAEKAEAVRMWRRIEELSRQIKFADEKTREFVVTSCTYGRIKYPIIEQGWTILMYGQMGDTTGQYDRPRLTAAIAEYDRLWKEWRALKESAPACSTLHNDTGRGGRPGLGAAVNRYRNLIGALSGSAVLTGTAAGPSPKPAALRGAWGDQGDGGYVNPILAGDYSDMDAIRVGDDYYAISSTFQFSPGVVVLKSKDLVNWTILSHAVDDLTRIGPELNWDRMDRYGRGIWAGAIRYHAGRFWIYFGTPDEGFFMTTAKDPAGPWEPLHQVWKVKGWDDGCPFWDDDGQGYFVCSNFSDNYKIHLFKMSPDGGQLLMDSDKVIHQSRGSEANKLYKINGLYYHYYSEARPEGRVVMMNRSKSLDGPWETKQLNHVSKPIDKEPNQGGLIQLPSGEWWFLTHQGSADWEGRAMCLLPITWINGWPIIGQPGDDGIGNMVWSAKKPISGFPTVVPQTDDEFSARTLLPQWEWNYQPRAGKWSLSERPGFLRLRAFKTLDGDNLKKAGNTLTQRAMRTATNEVTIKIGLSGMADGQHAGLCHFSRTWSMFGVVQSGESRTLTFDDNGKVTTGPAITATSLWLRSTWGFDGISQYSYSLDGISFIPFGTPYQLTWGSYRGDRVGFYSYNNLAERGDLDVDWFHYTFARPGR